MPETLARRINAAAFQFLLTLAVLSTINKRSAEEKAAKKAFSLAFRGRIAMASFDEELRSFLSCHSGSQSLSSRRPAALAGLRLMRAYPVASREAVLAFFADVCDAATDVHFRLREKLDSGGDVPSSATGPLERQLAEAIVILNALREALDEFVDANADAWAPIIATWALGVLGELSSKHTSWVSILIAFNIEWTAALTE